MVGGLYHAGGHNSTKDQKRPMHDLSFCRGYLRQEVSLLSFRSPPLPHFQIVLSKNTDE